MLFKLEHGKSPFELNPGLKAIEKFATLTDRQMSYVILISDYDSPFRKLKIEDKKYQAALESGYKLEKDGKRLDVNARNVIAGKDGKIEAACSHYREFLQWDEDYETFLSLGVLISQIRDFNNKPDKTPNDLVIAVNLNVGRIDKLVDTRKKLGELIDNRGAIVAEVVNHDEDDSINMSSLSILAKVNEGIL